jgi:outer membrane protein TolC
MVFLCPRVTSAKQKSDSPESVLTRGFFKESPYPLTASGSFDPSRSYELASLIELGLANNPRTRSVWFNALSKGAQVGQAKALYYPELSFSAQGGYVKTFYPTQNGNLSAKTTDVIPGLDLEYLLLDFGRRAADVRRTLFLLDAANLTFSRNVQTTVFAIQQSYFSYTAALSQRDAAKANLELSKTILGMVESQIGAGLGTKPELDTARKTFAQAEFDLAAADRNVEVTLGNLRVAAGLPANAPLKVIPGESHSGDAASPFETLSGNVDMLVDRAVKSRPDLAARESEIKASRAAVERAKADFLPKLSLQGDVSNDTYVYTAAAGPQTGTYYGNRVGYSGFAVLSWDLFDGFQRVEKVKQRQAEESQTRADAESTRLQTTQDVWTSYNDSLKSRKRVAYADSLVASAEENFKSAQAAFNNQLLNITDLISNQSALAAARFEQAGARADYLTSLAALSLAMGSVTTPRGSGVKPSSL